MLPVSACVLTPTPHLQFGCFWTNGQICSSTSRLLVQEAVAPAFLQQLKKRAEAINVRGRGRVCGGRQQGGRDQGGSEGVDAGGWAGRWVAMPKRSVPVLVFSNCH